MQNIFTRKNPRLSNTKDAFAICDLSGFAALADAVPADNENREKCTSKYNWTGNKDYNTSVEQVRNGDLSGVAASDEIMSRIEADSFLSPVWRNRLDVVGDAPCVPAFLAGHPMNMRRRERVLTEQGPLTVLVSLELSAMIDTATMRKRGAAILALVRVLSNSRPVSLYACCSVGGSKYGAHVIVRIDTAPLDLARAAHVLTCPSVTRGLSYAVCRELAKNELGQEWYGHWAYNDHSTYLRVVRETLMGAIDPNAETILIPAAHVDDPSVKEPETWLRQMVAKHGGGITEEAA